MRKVLLADAVAINVRRALLNKRAQAFAKSLVADDGDESNDRTRLKVLNDGDGVKLLMSIYQDYVSDDDYVKFPEFMYNVDTLLYKARGNRTLTREEREEMEESAPKRGRRGKRKPAKPEGEGNSDGENNNESKPTPPPITASDDLPLIGSFFRNYLKVA